MKSQYLAQLLSQPWNLDRFRARTILGNLAAKLLRNDGPETETPRPRFYPKMQRLGDVAIIPLQGTISMNVPDWIKDVYEGFVDANDVCNELDAAAADPDVAMVVVHVDSPGGLALAGDKLFDAVEAVRRRKPVFGWCDDGGEMCSAAYEACASATAILTGKYAAAVGCVGSYMAFVDDTAFWANMGFTWQVFRSGEFKGIGIDPLSEEQAAWLQAETDKAGAQFRARVTKYRTEIAAEDLRGQWFSGSDAAARGFTAGTAKDLSAALAKFRRMI